MPGNRNRFAWNRWHVVILLYICFIYGNSLTPAAVSSRESGFLLAKVQGVMESLGWEFLWLTEHIIRKTAHFAEYAVLGGLTARAAGIPGTERLKDALMLIFIVPFVDETIQLFVVGRSGQISDVWLDMSGAAVGMMITAGVLSYAARRKKRGR
ncbi:MULTISPECIES: VanZ family protein [unclassified Clostridium]|uniref:VanZ family protein n=1 Tax=unclassified Clostridium TaxID=2614128 RepID=UPI0011068B95|nr:MULTISPECIES: VanZ family protein [unclassified Clostridium]